MLFIAALMQFAAVARHSRNNCQRAYQFQLGMWDAGFLDTHFSLQMVFMRDLAPFTKCSHRRDVPARLPNSSISNSLIGLPAQDMHVMGSYMCDNEHQRATNGPL